LSFRKLDGVSTSLKSSCGIYAFLPLPTFPPIRMAVYHDSRNLPPFLTASASMSIISFSQSFRCPKKVSCLKPVRVWCFIRQYGVGPFIPGRDDTFFLNFFVPPLLPIQCEFQMSLLQRFRLHSWIRTQPSSL